ncbi:fimbrin-2 [Anaeramoeba flamelloides]|uniref:Fimbrin-2 n=1 Tax=Anaeramoeba flamelloides TaxID=1746091 RepID=A0ABQ8Y3Y0_9EUKA|nr:fimbrin-2 [Anaeramoeba flamelloides]
MEKYRKLLSEEVNKEFTDRQLQSLYNDFQIFDIDGDGSISAQEFSKILSKSGAYLTEKQVKRLMDAVDTDESDSIEFTEFVQMMYGVKTGKISNSGLAKKIQEAREGHSYSKEEKEGLVDFINESLSTDKDLSHILPIDPRGEDLFLEVSDGLLLAKLIHKFFPKAINLNQIKKGEELSREEVTKNIRTVLNSAKALGCMVTSIKEIDVATGKVHLIMHLIWQLARLCLMNQVKASKVAQTLMPKGTKNMSQSLPGEQIILRWINFHLRKKKFSQVVINFTTSLQDSTALITLFNAIKPDACDLTPLKEQDLGRRAELFLQNAKKIGCKRYISVSDIVQGNARVMIGFLATTLLKHPIIDTSNREEKMKSQLNESEKQLKKMEGEKGKLEKMYHNLKGQIENEKKEKQQLQAYLKKIETTLFDGVTKEEHKMLKELMRQYLEKGRQGGMSQQEANMDFVRGIKELVNRRVGGLKQDLELVKEEKQQIIKQSNMDINTMKQAYQEMSQDLEIVELEKEQAIQQVQKDKEQLTKTLRDLSTQVVELQTQNETLGSNSVQQVQKLKVQKEQTQQNLKKVKEEQVVLQQSHDEVNDELQQSKKALETTKQTLNQEREKFQLEKEELQKEYEKIKEETVKIQEDTNSDQQVLAQTLQELTTELTQAKSDREKLIEHINLTQEEQNQEKEVITQGIEDCLTERELLIQTMKDLENEIGQRQQEAEQIVQTSTNDSVIKEKITEMEKYANEIENDKQKISDHTSEEATHLRRRVTELEEELSNLERDIDIILGGTGSLEERLRSEVERRKRELKKMQYLKEQMKRRAAMEKRDILRYVEGSLGIHDYADWVMLMDNEGGNVVLGKKKWMRRWMVLYKGALSFFKVKDDTKPELICYLEEARIVKASRSRAKKENCLEIRTSTEVYIVNMRSSGELDKWFRMIKYQKRQVSLEEKVRKQKLEEFN